MSENTNAIAVRGFMNPSTMRILRNHGWKFVDIGKKYNVSYASASKAIKGGTWSHVK